MDIIKKATDFQVELQGVINELSDRMESVLSKHDRKILAQITETLRELIEVKQIDYRKLEAALKALKAARLEAFKGIENLLTDETKEIMQATLDSKTSKICAHYDRTVWKVGDKDMVTPPLHPNCRSVLIPYVKVLDENGDEISPGRRAAERENFDAMARDEYEKHSKKHNGKDWSKLSYDYRKQLMYKQIKAFEAKTGKSAYVQMKGESTFPEYFARRSAAFQKEWLGPARYRMYADGLLKLDQLVNPDTGFVRTVKELKELVGG